MRHFVTFTLSAHFAEYVRDYDDEGKLLDRDSEEPDELIFGEINDASVILHAGFYNQEEAESLQQKFANAYDVKIEEININIYTRGDK